MRNKMSSLYNLTKTCNTVSQKMAEDTHDQLPVINAIINIHPLLLSTLLPPPSGWQQTPPTVVGRSFKQKIPFLQTPSLLCKLGQMVTLLLLAMLLYISLMYMTNVRG